MNEPEGYLLFLFMILPLLVFSLIMLLTLRIGKKQKNEVDKPGLYRDAESGRVINVRSFRDLNCTFPLDYRRLCNPCILAPGEVWSLSRWSITIHPWPEIIPTSLIVKLTINDIIVGEAPLFDIAEPLMKPEDAELCKRLDSIEEALELHKSEEAGLQCPDAIKNRKDKPAGLLTKKVLVNQNHEIGVLVKGPDEDFNPLRKKIKVFELHVCGLLRDVASR